jgi:cell division septum initiation protein DivIVA
VSGGGFNYLCLKDASDLFRAGLGDAQDMVDALAELGYAPDAAQETAALIAEVRAAEARISAKIDRLRDTWKAMEWWRSCDWGEDQLKAALAVYRGEASDDAGFPA